MNELIDIVTDENQLKNANKILVVSKDGISSTIDWNIKDYKDIPIEERNSEELSYMEGVDENGNISFLPDINESSHGGQLDLATNNYTFNITRYVNKVFAGEFQNEGLTLVVGGSGITANRVILNGANSLNKDKPKLVLTYTKY